MKTFRAIVTSLCLVSTLQAQFTAPIDLFEPVGDIRYSTSADVDSDGRADVICATDTRLFWLRQLEDSTFSKQNLISTDIGLCNALRVADVNEDGAPDILFVAVASGVVSVYLNTGGVFSDPYPVFEDYSTVTDIRLADLDGDGHLDLITAAELIYWEPGDGNGQFQNATEIEGALSFDLVLEVADLDLDGDLDVVVADFSNDQLFWYDNDGNGNFSMPQQIEQPNDGPKSIAITDLDGDTLPDILCANENEEAGGAGLVWYRNTGNASFELADTLMSFNSHHFVHAVDIDQDGDEDVISCYNLRYMSWIENSGNGTFGQPQPLEQQASYLLYVETPDLNADGWPDLLYGLTGTNGPRELLMWRAGQGSGEFSGPKLLAMGFKDAGNPVAADFDQDGRLDVAIGSEGAEALVWLRNEGTGFSKPHLIARREQYDPGSIATADINEDGWPDILAGSTEYSLASPFCFYLNNGDGTFTAGPPFETTYFRHSDMHLVDMDQDGDLDMLYGELSFNNWENADVAWVPNEGNSWGEPVMILENTVNVRNVIATDFDADGFTDVVISQRTDPPILWLEATGDGNFSAPQPLVSDFLYGMYAQAIDLNMDGHLDLVASGEGEINAPDQIVWWPNDGFGQLGFPETIYEGGPSINTFVLEDYDQDGRVDIIGSTQANAPMQWLRQEEGLTFAPPQPIEGTMHAVRRFVMEDLDGDYDLDIVGNAQEGSFGETNRGFVSYNLVNDVGLAGSVFYDANANGQRDTQEVLLDRFPITIEPEALAVFTDEEGRFTVYGAEGTYNISPQLESCWALTTTPGSYEITFDGTPIDSLEFGVSPNSEEPEAGITLASAPTRCGFTVPFWLNYTNDGCWPFDGQAYLVLNDLAELVEATPVPAQSSGDTLFWDFEGLQPGESRSVALSMVIAGVEFIGSPLDITVGVVPYNAIGPPLPAATFGFTSIINCAYDPNDKQVHPARSEQPPFTQNYTLFEEPLLYTIRFQNTGTDTAFNVVLRDQLSEDLDWTTFAPGSSSHPYEAVLYEDGRLEFHFRDILLPDSTTNELESHGFVQFEIETLPGLDENTLIENTAGIYFDFNPPIITNTVQNVMVSELPDFTPAAAFAYETAELQAVFTDVSTNTPTSWVWDFGDGESSTEQHPEHTYAAPGTYTVCLTAANDWGEHTYCEEVTLISSGSTSLSLRNEVSLFPNPARDRIWIRCHRQSLPQRLQLYNATGQWLQTIALGAKVTYVDVNALPAGRYWVRTETGEVLPVTIVR